LYGNQKMIQMLGIIFVIKAEESTSTADFSFSFSLSPLRFCLQYI